MCKNACVVLCAVGQCQYGCIERMWDLPQSIRHLLQMIDGIMSGIATCTGTGTTAHIRVGFDDDRFGGHVEWFATVRGGSNNGPTIASGGWCATAETQAETLPRVQRFRRPDPYAGRDADHQAHEILQHGNAEFRLRRLMSTAGCQGAVWTLARDRHLPQHSVMLLVEVAADQNGRRDCVEHAENANSNHQLFELFNFRQSLLLFDNVMYAHQRDEAGHQKEHAQHQVGEQWSEDEPAQPADVGIADGTDPTDGITVHGGQGQNGDRFHRRQRPGEHVKVRRIAAYGLVAPLQAGS
ncbi:hypothetical protein T11_11213 [Trichinella zimbabwensis]|uniref:Uncharacterized protein n=1 Tax=Trichinella zimbabwensis TaxID=268475 RepID=A0A0V1HQH7_9BILA|nr:hypothetical protein T11_11213 [Trichinella zimbabwensis]